MNKRMKKEFFLNIKVKNMITKKIVLIRYIFIYSTQK